MEQQLFKEIGAFLVVARHRSFTQAAKAHGISQPTLSRHVARLEDVLGAPLFERNTRVVTLTHVGEALAQDLESAADRINLAFEATRRSIAGFNGQITIGFNAIPINQDLPSILGAFYRRFPGIGIELLHMASATQLERLRGNEIDIGLGSLPIDEPQFESHHLGDHTITALVPAQSDFARRGVVPVREMSGQTLIVGRDPDWSTFNESIFTYLHKNDVSEYRVVRAYDYESISALVSAGVGTGFFVDIAPEMARTNVVTLPFGDQSLAVPLYLNWRRKSANEALPHFVRFYRERSVSHPWRAAGRTPDSRGG